MKTDLFSLRDRVIIITGAAGLLGRQHADAIAAYGGIPVLLDLFQDPVEQLADDLRETHGVAAAGYAVDITQEQQVESNCLTVLKRFGRIDGLINNAANNPKVESKDETNFSRLENFPIDVWQEDLGVGLTGSFLCAKHYGLAISQNPKGGVILNISSDLGLIAPDQRLYERYWRILIGPWLGYFLQILFDRWSSIQQVLSLEEDFETTILNYPSSSDSSKYDGVHPVASGRSLESIRLLKVHQAAIG